MSTKFLIIRRDNIGDLLCTTPFLHALRQRFPKSKIALLINSYNQEVLFGNPDIDEVYVYTKAKHRKQESLFDVYYQKLKMIWRLRKERFDYVILASGGRYALQMAKWIRPREIIGEDLPPPSPSDHQVKNAFRLLAPLGIHDEVPHTLKLTLSTQEAAAAKAKLAACNWPENSFIIGIHISSRKPSQRWPVENFTALIQRLEKKYGAHFLLFWSPGIEDNPQHPGDDAKMEKLTQAQPSVIPFPTATLRELMGGLSLCHAVITSDGGAMHIAAALGKPLLCFFGNSSATHWHPWMVPHILLQPPSLNVADITVDEAERGFSQLLNKGNV